MLYLVKKFDMEGSVSADPELTKFDANLLNEFYNLCQTLNCINYPNEINSIRGRISNMLNAKRKHLEVEMYLGILVLVRILLLL